MLINQGAPEFEFKIAYITIKCVCNKDIIKNKQYHLVILIFTIAIENAPLALIRSCLSAAVSTYIETIDKCMRKPQNSNISLYKP